MKIGILCSHPFGFPSIELLTGRGCLAGLGAPEKGDFTQMVKNLSNHAFVPMSVIEDDKGKSLEKWLELVMADAVFVMGFPYKIPESILSIPAQGFYNFHPGLLPAYRGIDPVFWQIRNGEVSGGITVHRMDGGFDSGPVAHIEKADILPYETYGLHMQRLALFAREAAVQMMDKLSSGGPELVEQGESDDKNLTRPDYEDLLIRWDGQPAKSIKALVQASNPSYGGAITFYKGAPLHITQASVHRKQTPPGSKPGTVVSTDNGLFVLCADGKSLGIEIIYSDAGLFTGNNLVQAFNIEEGSIFSDKQFPDAPGN